MRARPNSSRRTSQQPKAICRLLSANSSTPLSQPDASREGRTTFSRTSDFEIDGQSSEGDTSLLQIFCENLRRYTRGLPLLNVVDKRKGYVLQQ
ncbi:TPA: hypothetical protein DCE37_13695 [Candidatus Latescibacteria bacterium]|nr:hypothetical protein [Candidatus Latescibacterota bacterium]